MNQAALSRAEQAMWWIDFFKKNVESFFRLGSGPGTSSAWFSALAWYTASLSSSSRGYSIFWPENHFTW